MEVGGGGERETIIPIAIHCHHQNDSCIKMGSDESHFNVSAGTDGQSHRTVSTNHNLSEEKGEPKRYQSHRTVSTNHNLFEEKGEPKRYRTEVLPLTNLTPYR